MTIEDSRHKRWQIIFSFLLPPASLLIAVLLFEVALRIVGYLPHLDTEWVLRSDRIPDRDVLLIPAKFLQPSFYTTDPARGTIIALGDSFTEGYPVDSQNTYPAILDRMLKDRGVGLQVINAGIGDSGPDQQLRFLQNHLLPRLKPAIVIWTFYSNDLEDNYKKATYGLVDGRLVPLDGRRHWLYIRQAVHLWAPVPSWVKSHSLTYQLFLKVIERVNPVVLPAAYAKNPTAWAAEKLRLEIQMIKKIAAEKNFLVYFVLIAPEPVYDPKLQNDPWLRPAVVEAYQRILAILKDENHFIHAWFPDTDSARIFVDGKRDPNVLGNRHYNESGYALLAETVARRLKRDGLL